MLLYNVTITIDLDIHTEWLEWMRRVHIPEVMATGVFRSYRLSRLIGHEHTDSEIYTIQYLAPDITSLRRYQDTFAPALQAAHTAKFEGRFGAFRTIMEVIEPNEAI
jgi:hypothetical protein